MATAVVLEDLRKAYGSVKAVSGVTLEVRAGEIFGLLGPNGAGKTTTIECAIGLRDPDAGRIEICGIDARAHPRQVKEKVGVALQTTALQAQITPREALTLFGSFYRQRSDPEHLLERFGLTEKADVAFDTLSGGQRQRLALAIAFVNRPEVVLLDEPTSGLDAQSRRELHAHIAAMKKDGHTVLLTTHYIAEAEALCDRLAIIDRGRVIAIGAPGEVMAQSSATPTVSLVLARPVEPSIVRSIEGVADLVCDGCAVRFTAASITSTLGALLQRLASLGVDVVELRVQKASLEDVFLELTATKGD
jgi:ABC-2 type transport system ATP-binding protein